MWSDQGPPYTDDPVVRQIQERLGGYTGAIDGKYGPLTATAVSAWQGLKGIPQNGTVDERTWTTMFFDVPYPGDDAAGGGGGPNVEGTLGDTAPPITPVPEAETTGRLPGKPKYWHDTQANKFYVVYFIPGVQPAIPLLWESPSLAKLQEYGGQIDRKTTAQINGSGAIPFGDVAEIRGWTDVDNPWTKFLNDMDEAKKVLPWLDDPEIFAIYAGAYLEGEEPEQYQLQDTDWWRNHNPAQRAWLSMLMGDPAAAGQFLDDARIVAYNAFSDFGVDDVPDELLDFLAEKVAHGDWTEKYATEQIKALVGRDSAVPLDGALDKFMSDGLEAPTSNLARVRSLFDRWLGPAFAPTEAELATWTESLDENFQVGEDQLIEELRQKRLNLYPNYTDPNATYESIASPWRSMAQNTWGVPVDDTDKVFQRIVQQNDPENAEMIMRKAGLKRGYDTVVQDAISSMQAGMKTGVVTPI